MYKYNSYHKIVVAILVVLWAIFHFSQRDDRGLYYENGQIKRNGGSVKSMNEGIWTWYYEDGTIQIRGNFHEGKREGIWESFDQNGNLISESSYVGNMLNGPFVKYGSDGQIIRQEIYENDKRVKYY